MPTGVGTALLISGLAAAGSSAAGAAISSHGNTKAAETNANASTEAARIQAESADKALAQANQIYQQQRADEGPYRESGYGALGALNLGLGLPQVSYQPPAAAAATPTNLPSSTINGTTFPGAPQVPTGTLSALGQAQTSGGMTGALANKTASAVNNAQQIVNQKYAGTGATTRVQAPNGLVYLVPNDKVAEAQQAGGKVMS